MVRFLIIGDLHGVMPKIFFKKDDFDAIIAPGDFCSDESRRYMFEAIRKRKESGEEVEWYDICGRKKAKKMIDKSLRDGRRVLEFLDSLNKPVFITPGNWDWTGWKGEDWKPIRENNYKKLIRGLENINDLHLKSRKWKNITFIGHGISSGPEIPIGKNRKNYTRKELLKRRMDYNKKMKKLSRLFSHKKNVIFMTHNVPYNTKLDMITWKESPRYGEHAGSIIARDFIKKHRPLIAIGGHMHEHFGMIKMGRTIVINAGFGGEVNTLLEVNEENNKVKKIKFVKKDKRREFNAKVGWIK